MTERLPPHGKRTAAGPKPAAAASNVADLEERRRETSKQIKIERQSHASQIRGLTPGKPLMGMPPGKWDPDEGEFGLPPLCPVKPLGRDGTDFFFLDAAGGVTTLSPSASGKAHIDALFAGQWPYLVWAWGRVKVMKDEAGDIKGTVYLDNYDAEKARRALFDAATDKGPWNMVDNVRGRGAWKGERGELILNVGDRLLIDGFQEEPCGEYQGKLYPKRPKTPTPAINAQPAGPESCGREALDLLKTWTWSRPELDPKLMLGWILAAMVGGALDWRPTVFITGDKATGKSTLQKVTQQLLGDSTVHAVETSAAGIYQVLMHDTLPVTVDELEADADNRKVKAVVELARVASSGGRMLRGGQDHHGRQFDLRCAFLFSAINAPPLMPQDRSRMALLQMKRLKRKTAQSGIDYSDLQETGTQLLRRVCDWWPRLPELLAAFRIALMDEESGRHDGRGADTFGTLAAFCHVALSDDMPTDDELKVWAKALDAGGLAELEAASENWKLCLRHLLQSQPDVFRNRSSKSVGELLSRWKAREERVGDMEDEDATVTGVSRRLGEVGLGLVYEKGRLGHWGGGWLFVPNDHDQVAKIFMGSRWSGAGVWTGALRQADECQEIRRADSKLIDFGPGVYRQGTGTVGGVKMRGTLVRLETMFAAAGEKDEEEGEDGGA